MKRPSRTPTLPLPLLIPAVLTGLGVTLPLCYLLLRAFEADADSLREIVWRSRNLLLLGNTLGLTLAVLLCSTLIALPMAVLAARSDLRVLGRRAGRALTVLGTLPLSVPGYVGAYVLLAASGPGGSIEALTGLNWPAPSGFAGALGILTLFNFPYLFLNLYTALKLQDPALEDAARLLGRTPWQTFRAVTLPQLRAAWLAGALLIALHVLGDFGVSSVMRFETFSAAIYTQYTAAYDRVYSAWLSLLLLSVTGLTLWLEARLLRALIIARTAPGTARPLTPLALGRLAAPAWAFCALLLGAAVLVPLLTLGYWLRGALSSLDPYLWESWLGAARNSVLAAGVAALTTTALAFPLAYVGSRYQGRLARVAQRLAYVGYATPPLAFALALIFFTLRVVPSLYQTFTLLILAYTLHFLAEAIGPQRSALAQASPRLEEAARTLGLSPWQTLRRVTLPLVRPGLWASLAFVFLSTLKELPLTLLLSPGGFDTLARNIWTYTSEAQYAAAAPYALTVILASGAFVALTLSGRRERNTRLRTARTRGAA
jgi:iron(III) transport system permease protein